VLGSVQYTAFYKFLVSIGVILVGLGLAVPWLMFQESFDLLVKQADLDQLTSAAQETIRHRQALIRLGSLAAPWISAALIIAGITISGVGLAQWRRRQAVLDRTEEAALRKAEAETEILLATPPERDRKQGAEAWADLREREPPQLVGATSPAERAELNQVYEDLKKTIAGIQDIVVDKLESAFASTHTVVAQAKLTGDGQEQLVDAVLTPMRAGEPGYVIEVVYISGAKGLGNRTRSAADRLMAARRLYRANALVVHAVLLFVVADEDSPQLMAKLQQRLPAPPDGPRAVALFESELERISPDKLRSRLLDDEEAERPEPAGDASGNPPTTSS
jgi:hypothetical protein